MYCKLKKKWNLNLFNWFFLIKTINLEIETQKWILKVIAVFGCRKFCHRINIFNKLFDYNVFQIWIPSIINKNFIVIFMNENTV